MEFHRGRCIIVTTTLGVPRSRTVWGLCSASTFGILLCIRGLLLDVQLVQDLLFLLTMPSAFTLFGLGFFPCLVITQSLFCDWDLCWGSRSNLPSSQVGEAKTAGTSSEIDIFKVIAIKWLCAITVMMLSNDLLKWRAWRWAIRWLKICISETFSHHVPMSRQDFALMLHIWQNWQKRGLLPFWVECFFP